LGTALKQELKFNLPMSVEHELNIMPVLFEVLVEITFGVKFERGCEANTPRFTPFAN
jgi:hypothetical protein